jgi:hypothetical protein
MVLIRPPYIGYEISEDRLEKLTVRGRRAVFTAANAAMAKTWQDKFKALHFKPNARYRYSYQKRAVATMKRKKRLVESGQLSAGDNMDLVQSGNLRRAVLRYHPITATPKFSKIVLQGPTYFNIRYRPGRPNIADEVTRIIPSEGTALGQAALDAAEKEIERQPRKRRKKIG